MNLHTALLRVIIGRLVVKVFGHTTMALSETKEPSLALVILGLIAVLCGIVLYVNGFYHAFRILSPYSRAITY